jgi:hypothetical protein
VFHQFPYRKFDRERKDGTLEPILRPTVDYTIRVGDLAWSEDALIDTGSPVTLFTHEVGKALNVPYLQEGSDYDSFAILGHLQVAQRQRVQLSLNKFPELQWGTDAWFFVRSWDWKLNVGAVFGTAGFLDHWAVTFVKSHDYFVVENLESFERRIPPDTVTLTLEEHDQDWWRPTAH